jgi:hypothetical protein
MKMVSHKSEAIYRRYEIAEEKMLIEAADKLEVSITLTSGQRNFKVTSK